MIAEIQKSNLCGQIKIPSSKSASHRAVISAALSDGTSCLSGITLSADIEATLNALTALGAQINTIGDHILVKGIQAPAKSAVIDCGESGSTLRFLIPVAAALGVDATFIGHGRLPQRPLHTITDLLKDKGMCCGSTLPLHISGQLTAGTYSLSGDISSQFITGLMYALCLFDRESEIILTSHLQSAGYVDMTAESLRAFGCRVDRTPNGYIVCGKATARDIAVEGDFSQAAFYLEAAALGNQIDIHGLDKTSVQGDKKCVELFEQMGCHISWGDTLKANGESLKPLDIDASQIPDLVPALAVTLAFAPGKSTVYNAARLRIKESDRLDAIAQNLNKMGIRVDQTPDSITIYGGQPKAATLCGFNDHRIVMAFAVAASITGGRITDAEAINKSYPKFFEDFKSIGGTVHVF